MQRLYRHELAVEVPRTATVPRLWFDGTARAAQRAGSGNHASDGTRCARDQRAQRACAALVGRWCSSARARLRLQQHGKKQRGEGARWFQDVSDQKALDDLALSAGRRYLLMRASITLMVDARQSIQVSRKRAFIRGYFY